MKFLTPFLATVLMAASLLAAPPDVGEIKPVQAGRYVVWTPPDTVESATYHALCHTAEPFPIELISDDPKAKRKFFLDTAGLKEANYKYLGVFSNNKGEQAKKEFTVTIGKPPIVIPPPDTDPVPVPTVSRLYVLVRPDGPASQAWVAMLAASEWDTVKQKGHSLIEYTKTKAGSVGFKTDGLTLPVVLHYEKTGMKDGSAIYKEPLLKSSTAPRNGAEILQLAN